jgi:hypothetical protein
MEEIKVSSKKNIIITVVCLLLAYGEIVGIYHSYNKHSKEDGIYSVIIPPLAWYRSVEIWLHKDVENVDWNEKLKSGTKSCLVILTQYGKADSVEINAAVADLKLQLKKYPKDKYDYVKEFGRKYFSYYQTAQKEFNRWIIEFFNGGDIRYQKTQELCTIQNTLSKYGIDELNNSMKHNDSLFVLLHGEYNRMKQQYIKTTPEGKKQFLEVIFRKDNINMKNIKAAYKSIFDEDIKK